MKRKLWIMLLCLLLLLTLAACGDSGATEEETAAAAPQETAVAENESALPQEDKEAAAEDTQPETKEESANKTDETEEAATEETPSDSAPSQTETEPAPAPAPAPQPAPYSQPTADTVLTVSGSALDRDWYFSLSDLQSLGGAYSGSYFSRGKEPQEATTSFSGIMVSYLLDSVIGASYSKATFTASDGYAGSYGPGAVDAWYINEKDPSASLPMILAWTEDGSPCGLRLVMGQQIAGEYNRTYWVRDVITVTLQ
ncbi:MAG: hypothetical protein IKG74_01960 [Firmicutes bacterium]|nr:hypothetical protein [Bacillota bacterium]